MSVPLTFEQYIQQHSHLHRKLLFWAHQRFHSTQETALSLAASQQVQAYLTELVLEADPQKDNSALLCKWSKTLTQAELNALAYLSPIHLRDYANVAGWYNLAPGEYTTLTETVFSDMTYQGQEIGVITRNRYGCLVLNAHRLLIVDVDIGVPAGSVHRDCARSSSIALSQQQAIAALEALAEQFPQLGFRVYRTRNGLRYLCTTQEFDPTAPGTVKLMQNLYTDPLYLRLCQFQACFRARLTPKPWRVKDEEPTQQFAYDRITGLVLPQSSRYAVCHLIEIIGKTDILPQFERAIDLHDAYCRSSRLGLALA